MENNQRLLDSFCDWLTDELVRFEGREKILARSFNTNINLIETIAVTLIIELRKRGLNVLNSQDNDNRWREYFLNCKLFVKSALLTAISYFRRRPKRERVCFFEYYPHNLRISESIINVAPDEVGFLYVSLREKVFSAIGDDYPVICSHDFGLIDIVSLFKVNKAVNIFVNSLFTVINDVNRDFLLFRPVFSRILNRELVSVVKFVSQYKRMIKRLQPKKAVFTTDSVSFVRLIIQLCKEKEINTVTIQHGLMPNSRLLKLMITDNYIVWGPYYKQLIQFHNRRVAVHVVGSLKLAHIVAKYSGIRKEFRKILYATSPPSGTSIFLEDYEMVLREICRAAKELPDHDFFIKLHPSEGSELIEGLLLRFGASNNIFLLNKSEDIYYHIATSRLVLFVSSTVSLEALLLNTPVICLNFDFFADLLPYQDVAGFYEVKSEGTLLNAIKTVLKGDYKGDIREGKIEQYCLKVFNQNEAIKEVF